MADAKHTDARRRQWRERNAKRRQDPEYQEAQREYYRKWHEQHKGDPELRARKAEQMRAYTKKPDTRLHHEARWKVHRAIKAGRLQKMPCEVCGNSTAQAHHDDYSRPLDIRWLCRKHHVEHHAKATGQGGGV